MKPTGHILPAAHVQRYAAYLREQERAPATIQKYVHDLTALLDYARAMGYDTSARGDLSGFADIPENYWAGDALEWAYAEHLITGTSDTSMGPTGQASRAQIAVIMMRFCERYTAR